MTKCPWCEKYIETYLDPNSPLNPGEINEKELKIEKERLNKGFWATIDEAEYELYLLNKNLTPEKALELGFPIHINVKNGEIFVGRLWFYELAKLRDKALMKKLKHFWILSGGCSKTWITPICCEMATFSSDLEQVKWEIDLFPSLAEYTRKVI